MSQTQELLGKIRALRERLEAVPGLTGGPGAGTADEAAPGGDGAAAGRLRLLQDRVAGGLEHHDLLDGTLKQLADVTSPPDEIPAMPTLLTSRARRALERGRDLLRRLRAFAEDFGEASAADPLAVFYRETVAMTDATLRTVQAFPDAPSAQLRLAEGLEAILGVVAQRLATLGAATGQRRREAESVHTLAEVFAALHAGRTPDVKPVVALAEALVEEANQLAPLRLLYDEPERPARFVACHGLAVAQVAARVVRGDPEWRGRAVEPVLAALVHDVGMLDVPAAVLYHPGPLNEEQRRLVEGHAHAGAALASRLLPSGPWLAEAVAMHHERLDGTGYPAGLRNLQLPALPRLLAVCDVYAALCAPRPHRPARETRTALTDTLLLAEQGALDRYQAERLLQLSFYPVGSVVELADGAVGVVVATPLARRDLTSPARPVLALLTDAQGRPLPLPQHLDLAQCESRSIVRSLSHAERRDLLGRRHPELV
jgi:hypothetical protein